MRKQQRLGLLGFCLGMAFWTCCASEVNSEKLENQTNIVYTVNQSKTYKVMVPKRGYIGAHFPSSVPSITPRYPTNENHFRTCYFRITIIADRRHKGNQRIVLRLDEVDDNINLMHLGVYYSYIDFLPEGIKIITQREDNNDDFNDDITMYEIPFPFLCARPPQLGFKHGNSEGQKDITGVGVRYFKNEKKDKSSVVSIEAERFENREGLGELAARTAKWYTSEVDDVVKSKETKILYKENQKWASDSEWLWDEMERFDKDGNILMKCKKIQ